MLPFIHFLTMNARISCYMTKKLNSEMLDFINTTPNSDLSTNNAVEIFNAPRRQRLLRWTRQLSAWLILRWQVVASGTRDDRLNRYSHGLREGYLELLRTFMEVLPHAMGVETEYLLEEDEATIGFVPFSNFALERHKSRYYLGESGKLKPPWHSPFARRLGNTEENLARVGDILRDGFFLSRLKVSR